MSNHQKQQNGISREFAARLDSIGAKQLVRAIVMLQAGGNGEALARRQSRQERQETIERFRQFSRDTLPEIDHILEQYDGKRLSQDVDALGSISVETTAEGIRALASSEHVKAVFEDQPIIKFASHKKASPYR